ncbi:hypothetical protein RV04_GL000554 [Enterococcus hermanniensis]|uniref:PepSY domain-containing protein n=1 Tax=Enterococcus hermanniensis TaxID=249189 RepID=A0A1L8TJ97_9ENTE|nr:hypothetical protein RV04_GL000554 [Enterococcus hermanniensis]
MGAIAGCSSSSTDGPSLNSSSAASQSKTMNSQTMSSGTERKVSVDEAAKLFKDNYPETDITSLDLEKSLGKYVYKIEGVDDTKEYELQIDSESKKVSKKSEETLDSDEQNGVKRKEDKLDLNDLLTIDEVSKIAVKEVGSGEATEWSLDKDLAITYWEVKVKDGQKEAEVKINAQSGKVLATDLDD